MLSHFPDPAHQLCLQLCNVSTFCCTVKMLHKAKSFGDMKMPGGILHESCDLYCICTMEAGLNSLAFIEGIPWGFICCCL